MELTLGLITDFHFGPEASFGGKLRKLSARGPRLLEAFVQRMNEHVRPQVIVNLGDDIEDESPQADRVRYADAMRILAGAEARCLHVAGNHDLKHLSPADLCRFWGKAPESPLYGCARVGGFRLITLHTDEVKDQSVSIDQAQLDWLAAELASSREAALVFMHHSAADQVLVGNRWFERAPHICLVRERKVLRAIFERSGVVRAVFNGHLHWNHLDLHGQIPYVTLQSPIENLEDDAPGRPAGSFAVVRVNERRLVVEVFGADDVVRYQFELAPLSEAPSGVISGS